MNYEADLIRKVAAILKGSWDPLGIAKIEQAADEYGSYAPQIMKLLKEGSDATTISGHLAAIERHELGLIPDPACCMIAAKRLIRTRDESEI